MQWQSDTRCRENSTNSNQVLSSCSVQVVDNDMRFPAVLELQLVTYQTCRSVIQDNDYATPRP